MSFDISQGDAPKEHKEDEAERERSRERMPMDRNRSTPPMGRAPSSAKMTLARKIELESEILTLQAKIKRQSDEASAEVEAEKVKNKMLMENLQELNRRLQLAAHLPQEAEAALMKERSRQQVIIDDLNLKSQTAAAEAREAGRVHFEKTNELEGRCKIAAAQSAHLNTMNNAAERRVEELEQRCAKGDVYIANINQQAQDLVVQAKAEAERLYEKERASWENKAEEVDRRWRTKHDNTLQDLNTKLEISRDALAAQQQQHLKSQSRLSIEDKDAKELIEKLEQEVVVAKRSASMEQGKATKTEMELKDAIKKANSELLESKGVTDMYKNQLQDAETKINSDKRIHEDQLH